MFRFQKSKTQSAHNWPALLLGLGLACLLVSLVPFLQHTLPLREYSVLEIQSIESNSPPPLPPEKFGDSPTNLEEEPPPSLEMNRPPTSHSVLKSLKPDLRPRSKDRIKIDMSPHLNIQAEIMGDWEELLKIEDLDEIPRLVKEGPFRYPANAPHARGEAFVRLLVLIEPDGSILVQNVVDYSHKEFIEPACRMAEGSRFSPPLKNGLTVRSSYEWPIRIPLK